MLFGIYYLDCGAQSSLPGVFVSFGVPRQANRTVTVIAVFSPAGICSDDPTRVQPVLNERPSSPVGCQLSVPWYEEAGRGPRNPLGPSQLHRTRSHGELLMIHMMAWASHCLGDITQGGTNNCSQCHLIMAQKANLTDLHSSQG